MSGRPKKVEVYCNRMESMDHPASSSTNHMIPTIYGLY